MKRTPSPVPGSPDYDRAYDAAHPEERKAQHAAWYAAHRAEQAAYHRAYRAERRESVRAASQVYYQAHREERRAYAAAGRDERRAYDASYYEAHREERSVQSAAWRAANPVRALELARRAAAIRRGARVCDHASCLAIGAAQLAWSTSEHVCWMCGTQLWKGVNLHMDHVTPVSRGGVHCAENIRPACRFCNLSKHNRVAA